MKNLSNLKVKFTKKLTNLKEALHSVVSVEDEDTDETLYDERVGLANVAEKLLSHDEVEHLFKGSAVLFSDDCPHKTVSNTSPDYVYVGVTYNGLAMAYYHPSKPEDGFAADELMDLSTQDLIGVCENVFKMFV